MSIKELSNRDISIFKENIDKPINFHKPCGNFECDISHLYIKTDHPLYKPNYLITTIELMNEFSQKKEIFILICRFLGNYFKILNEGKSKIILLEDFVTSINKRNSSENDSIFYTGLKNGKLIEWKLKIIEITNSNNKKNTKLLSTFIIKEKKHVYAHKSSITAIEINNTKNIIATAGEDKFIYIRKIYNFELLTQIDLTYSFGNPIVLKNPYVFPTLIRISELNCIYVLLYNYKTQKTVIRGYTLNGLFFAESDKNINGEGNNVLSFNSISFNSNWNLIVGLYNFNGMILLNSYDLKAKFQKRFVESKNKHY